MEVQVLVSLGTCILVAMVLVRQAYGSIRAARDLGPVSDYWLAQQRRRKNDAE
jgi:hypothetical protein